MKKIACIPARYASARFPAKLVQMLGNKTIIRYTYENTVATNLFDEVFVITDSEIIFNEIKNCGGRVLMSKRKHESGSDRIAEAIENIDADVILNVQGDEPFVKKQPLADLLKIFENDTEKKIQVASLMHEIKNKEEIENINNVKVVVNKNADALLFSRSVIPFSRDKDYTPIYYKHIGIYAYRKDILLQFTKWKPSPLELSEKLEQLRYLENGVAIKMVFTDLPTIGIDTKEDLEKALKLLSNSEVRISGSL